MGRGRHPDRRVRLLIGPRHHGQIVEREIFARVREPLLRPGLENDVERFLEALAALVVPNAVPRVGARKAAAPDAEVEAALADLVDGGGLLGGADGVTQREDADPGADPEAGRAGGDGRGQHQRHGGDRRDARTHGIGRSPVHGEVPLGQPDAIEPLGLRDLGDGHRFGKRLFLRSSLPIVAFHHQADMHTRLLHATLECLGGRPIILRTALPPFVRPLSCLPTRRPWRRRRPTPRRPSRAPDQRCAEPVSRRS